MLCVCVCAGFTFVPQHTLTQHTILLYPPWLYLNKIDMMAGASCSLHLSLSYSDEIILTFSQKHGKSSGAFLTTAALSIILNVKSDLVRFGTCIVQSCISYDAHFKNGFSVLFWKCWIYILKKPTKKNAGPSPIYPSYFIQQYNFCSSEYNQYKIHMKKYILNRRGKKKHKGIS